MTITTLANSVQTLQNTIYNILKSDTTTITFTHADSEITTRTLGDLNIMDGIPVQLIEGVGFPYIIVHTPEENSERLTLTKHKTEFNVHIEIIGKYEGNVRTLTDAVKDALHNAQATTKASGYWWYGRRIRTNLNYTYLQSFTGKKEGKPVWHMDLFLTYLWMGS